MNRTSARLLLASTAWLALCSAAPAEAGEEAPSRSQPSYDLFHPVPEQEMREFSTDRPDKTESPFTVDAGHFQVEMDLLTYTRDRASAEAPLVHGYGALIPNLKVGLTDFLDFQAVLGGYRTQAAVGEGSVRGYGDTVFRAKVNLLGNNGGPVALGLMPFVKAPTGATGLGNDKVEGGLILPVALELPSDWSMGFMLELDKSANESDGGYHTAFVSSATVGHSLFAGLEGYVEFYSLASNEKDSAWAATVDAGLVLPVGKRVRLDAGVNIGVTDAADDLNPFVGLSFRL